MRFINRLWVICEDCGEKFEHYSTQGHAKRFCDACVVRRKKEAKEADGNGKH